MNDTEETRAARSAGRQGGADPTLRHLAAVRANPQASSPRRTLFGIPIEAATIGEALARIDETIRRKGRLHIGVVNAAKIVNMHRNALLMADVLSSDLILADGVSVVWASRLLRQPLPERVAGIDLMMGIFARAHRQRYRIYCLGATDAVLDKVTRRLAAEYPGLVLAGCRNGYFAEEDEPAVAAGIARTHPDVLLVAMTSPKKEQFMARWGRQLHVPVCHGVGGSFDVFAGKVQRAPEAWQRLGLEWLYRVKQEPRRLWRRYLVTNTLFCGMILGEFLRQTGFLAPLAPPPHPTK
jgi:N-acetylglucosaminyldiphosphoundecaprenol N-acetyl-beta-D-mannosaminyltransferase